MTDESKPEVIEYDYCDKRVYSYLYRTDLTPLGQYTIYKVVCYHCGRDFPGLGEITDNQHRVTKNCLGLLNSDKRVATQKHMVWYYYKRKYIALHHECKEILETAPEI